MKLNIPILTRLWEVYQERQQYRKQVQHRLLRRRTLKQDRSSTPLSPEETGHWTDRFLKSIALLNIRCLTLLLLLVVLGQQSSGQVVPLKIGETLPAQLWQQPLKLTNSQQQSIKLDDYKGKLIILDFWASWCSPCIALVPKMDSLQVAFKDDVQFVAVAYQKKNEVDAFLKKVVEVKGLKVTIPQVVEETELTKYFPHKSLPHYVWINNEGKIISMTGFQDINANNIQAQLKGNQPQFLMKQDDAPVKYDRNQPLFGGDNGGKAPIYYRRLFSGYSPGLSGGSSTLNPGGNTWIITAKNQSISSLFQLAFSNGKGKIPHKRVAFDLADRNQVYSPLSGVAYVNWMKDNHAFCYEVAVAKDKGDAFAMMQEDLANFFPQFKVGLETRTVPALVLKIIGNTDLLKSKGGTASINFDAFGCKIQNSFLNHLVLRLENTYLSKDKRSIINETGYTGRIDLEIKGSLSNLPEMNKQLAKYGLSLVEELRPVELLVIADQEGAKP